MFPTVSQSRAARRETWTLPLYVSADVSPLTSPQKKSVGHVVRFIAIPGAAP